MTLIEKIRQLERLHRLIQRKATGSPAELAHRLNLSERSIYNLIDQMKSMGAPIKFCPQRQSYHYEESVEFHFGFLLNENKNEQIKGGKRKMNYFDSLQEFCSERIYVCHINGH